MHLLPNSDDFVSVRSAAGYTARGTLPRPRANTITHVATGSGGTSRAPLPVDGGGGGGSSRAPITPL